MKTGTLNGQATERAEKNGRMLKRERSFAETRADSTRIARLLHIAHEIGGPLNVVLGRMEYLLERDPDRQTVRSLKSIVSQGQRLVEQCQQLMDEARIGLIGAEFGQPYHQWRLGCLSHN